MAIEEHIAGEWHNVALQETIEFLQHECLMNHLYFCHFAGCAVSFDKDTFHSDLWVDSVNIHDTRTAVSILPTSPAAPSYHLAENDYRQSFCFRIN